MPASSREECRQRILEDLDAAGDLVEVKDHEMAIGRCQRSDDIVEPRLKTQWFIDVKPMAERAMAAVREKRTRFVPERFEKVFFDWLENIYDWNISRQLWWGHRIPAWYCPDGHVTVSDVETGPGRCVECRSFELAQDEDTFDTWFSSGLWPFSTLGWPEKTNDLQDLLPDAGHGDRARHPLLLGRAHDDDGRMAHRPGAVQRRLPERAHPRPLRQEDVQDQGQRHRPARGHG